MTDHQRHGFGTGNLRGLSRRGFLHAGVVGGVGIASIVHVAPHAQSAPVTADSDIPESARSEIAALARLIREDRGRRRPDGSLEIEGWYLPAEVVVAINRWAGDGRTA